MGFIRRIFSPRREEPVALPSGPSPEEIRKQEQEKIRKENLEALRSQEERRRSLRGALQEDEDEEIQRKRLFGE